MKIQMKYFITKILCSLYFDRYPLVPKKVVIKLSDFRKTLASWEKMPEESSHSLKKFDNYWTSDRIKEALHDFQTEYNNKELRLYAHILMSCSEIKDYENVLDFGAGTGHHSHLLSKKYPEKYFSCYDITYHIPRIFNVFSESMTTDNVSFHNNIEKALKSSQLIYSNLVFSHLSQYQFSKYLDLFKKNQCDVLAISNTLVEQGKKFSYTKTRSGNIGIFDHNYSKFLNDAGYDIKWLYQIKDPLLRDKNMTIFYATIPQSR